MANPPESPEGAARAALQSEVAALRAALFRALDSGNGDLDVRRRAALRDALLHCERVAAGCGLDAAETGLPDTATDTKGFILAGRQMARAGRHPVSLLMLRPAAGDPAPALDPMLSIVQRQLRAVGDLARLLDGGRVIAITLESDRPGGLAALRRIARALAESGLDLAALEYSLTELDHAAPGEGIVRRVGEGFRPLTAEPERTAPRRVLALDDDPSVLAVIVEQLEGSGLDLEIESTTSGFEACIRFGEFEPDLVILDIRMPEIDGRDALSTMKRASGGRDVKFIVASAMPEYFDDVRQRGCDACLQKPFDLDELTDTVARLLGVAGDSGARPRAA